MATDPHYIASTQASQKTPLLTVPVLLHVAIGMNLIENTASPSYSTVACYTAIT
jgi:hypothetical protein